MKLIIAGGRDISEKAAFVRIVKWSLDNTNKVITEVVSGTATGVDAAGEEFAESFDLPVKRFYPDWDQHGKTAGPIRNRQMAEYADCLLLIWDGSSKGSASMKTKMRRLGKPVYEVIIETKKIEPLKGYWSNSDDL